MCPSQGAHQMVRLRAVRSPYVRAPAMSSSRLRKEIRRATLGAAGRRVIAYVRRPDQIGRLEALGLRPTTDIGDLIDCEVVISMLPDDDAVREIVCGRRDDDLDGLAGGLLTGG